VRRSESLLRLNKPSASPSAQAAELAAKAAADAQERVRAAVEALETEHAAAAEAHALTDPLVKDDDAHLDGDDDHSDGHATFEAASIAHLHAQAAGVQNIGPSCPLSWTPSPPTTTDGVTLFSSRWSAMHLQITSSST
jgi:hypothetical protein